MSEIINVPISSQRTLDVVTAEIRVLQDNAKRIALEYSIEVGRRLTEAKTMVERGEWGTYIKEKLGFSASTAENHMRLFQAYGADQISLTGAVIKSQAFENLSYTQALALLAMPEEKREDFISGNDVQRMSTRELREAIRRAEEAEKRAAVAEADAEGARQETRRATAELDRQKATAKAKEDMAAEANAMKDSAERREQDAIRRLRELQTAKQAAEERAAEAEIAAQKAEEKARNTKPDEATVEDIRKKAAKEAKKNAKEEAEKAFTAERDKLQKEAEEARTAAEKAKAQAEALRKELALASPDAANFKLLFEQLQAIFNQTVGVLEQINAGNPDQGEKLTAAMKAMLTVWTRKIEACRACEDDERMDAHEDS